MKKGRRAQLDRENAHFILSEAMISTFEQVIASHHHDNHRHRENASSEAMILIFHFLKQSSPSNYFFVCMVWYGASEENEQFSMILSLPGQDPLNVIADEL